MPEAFSDNKIKSKRDSDGKLNRRKYRVLNIFGSLAYISKDYGEETKVRTFLFYIYCFVIERYCLAR